MSASADVPTLAYAPRPLSDEPLDAWLGRVAQALCISASGLQAMLVLPRRTSFSVVRDLSEAQLRDLAQATGLELSTLREMTLARWESIGLRPRATQRGHGSGAWARGRGSRQCSQCLGERGGIPRLQWYLHWSFVCVRHECLLQPTTRGAPQKNEGGGLLLDKNHPAIGTQAALDAILEHPSQAVWSLGEMRPAGVHMRDLAALTRMAAISIVSMRTEGCLTLLSGTDQVVHWAALAEGFRSSCSFSPAKCLQEATQQPAVMALAATLAHDALAVASTTEASRSLAWLAPTSREEAVHHARSRQLSWPLVQALDNADSRSRPARQLILRFGLARFSDDGSRRSPLDPAKVPASIWSSVAVGSTASSDIAPVAASAALLAIGSTRGVRSALDRIGHPHVAARVRADWHRAFDSENDGMFETLLALHHCLVEGVVPINYARRRRSFAAPIAVGHRKARRIARELDVALTETVIRHASWYVFELLTGSNVLLTPALLDLWAPHRLAYRRQRAAWIVADPQVLREVAEQELLRLRINEPLTWHPEPDGREWGLPPPALHLLPGWGQGGRTMRGHARLTRSDISGYALDEAVALASHGNTMTARHIARNLNRFAAVAAGGSIRAGAAALGVTIGTLSVQMADLERDLATTLLDRTGPCATLTADGRDLLRLVNERRDDIAKAVLPAAAGTDHMTDTHAREPHR